MTELEQIAASVAKALGLKEYEHEAARRNYWTDGKEAFRKDGDGLFNAHWQVQARDWLLERGWSMLQFPDIGSIGGHNKSIHLECPAAEFCARAIHELMGEKP